MTILVAMIAVEHSIPMRRQREFSSAIWASNLIAYEFNVVSIEYTMNRCANIYRNSVII